MKELADACQYRAEHTEDEELRNILLDQAREMREELQQKELN